MSKTCAIAFIKQEGSEFKKDYFLLMYLASMWADYITSGEP